MEQKHEMPENVKAIWQEWNALPDSEPSPVKTIAAKLNLTTAEVASVVFPVDVFGVWDATYER